MNRDINALEPDVAHMCRSLIGHAATRGISLIVTCTLRDRAQQRALYAQGRSPLQEVNALRVLAGMPRIRQQDNRVVTGARVSAHERGRAFDIAITHRGAAVWDTEADNNGNATRDYLEVGLLGESLGLTWGGRFKRRDMCHFEHAGKLETGQLHSGMRLENAAVPDTLARRIMEEAMMEKVKSGLRTSEFYMAIIGAMLPVLNSHLGLNVPVGGIMSIAGVVVSYIISRTVVKKK